MNIEKIIISAQQNDSNVLALILAIVYDIEITSTQALRAVKNRTPLPLKRHITKSMLIRCRIYLETGDYQRLYEYANRNKVNIWELVEEAKK